MWLKQDLGEGKSDSCVEWVIYKQQQQGSGIIGELSINYGSSGDNVGPTEEGDERDL